MPSPAPGADAPAASPSAPPVAWSDLALPPLIQVAELTADDSDAIGPNADTTFTLRSLDGTPAVTLAKGLTVEPAIDLAIRPGPDRARAIVRPRESLAPGGTYRFTLAAQDGTIGGGWAFVVAAPPKVVGTLPADRTSGVPIDTGIELTFDRDDVADPTRWFSITPRVKGRFERHERTWVFVPDGLAPSTVYTVTLRAGLPLEGSDLALEDPVTVRFETAGPEKPRPLSIVPATVVTETPPDEPPIVAVAVTSSGEVRPQKSVRVAVYRVPDADAAGRIVSQLMDRPWEGATPRDAVVTDGMSLVGRLTVPLILDSRDGYAGALRFQRALAQGWYLLDLPDDIAAGQQVLLQVTPVAAYTVVARDRTLVWANRIGGGPIDGATVRVVDGPSVGVTGADGLMLASTPPETPARDPKTGSARSPVFVVEAGGLGAVVRPVGIGEGDDPYGYGYGYGYGGPDPWSASATSHLSATLETDRSTYRSTDSVAAWGMARDVVTGEVPARVELVLETVGAESWGWDRSELPPRAPVARAEASTSPLGVFVATVDLEDLPVGSYSLSVRVGDRALGSTWIEVGTVRKPAYGLDVSVDHRAVMTGDPVVITGHAAFYDGTPVASLPLRVQGPSGDEGAVVPTGTDGRASRLVHPTASGEVSVSTAGTELGQVGSASLGVQVFPSAYDVEASSATIGSRSVRVTGRVRSVDLAQVEAAMAAGEEWMEHVGPAAPGILVHVSVRPRIWVPRRTGTAYDFILKKAVAVYAYDERELPALAGTGRTKADGTFVLDVALPAAARDLRADVAVELSVTDASGRVDTTGMWAERAARVEKTTLHVVWLDPGAEDDPAYALNRCSGYWQGQQYKLGETVRLVLRDSFGPVPASASTRFLFLTARDGIEDVTLSSAAVYRRPLDAAAARGFYVLGAAFDGRRFRVADGRFHATLDPESYTIEVSVGSDLAAGAVHRPGDPAWVEVRTRDLAGRPVAADVVVRAVDAKLYDAGMAWAWAGERLWYEYTTATSGVIGTSASHDLPERVDGWGPGYGCGSTTGGGGGAGSAEVAQVRDDFRDRVLFTRVRTGADGVVRVPFDLSDDLTAWRVTASAVTEDLRTGSATMDIPVGLPFFVEPVAADVVLALDVPGVVLRAYGSALRSGDTVHYTVRAPSLLASPVTVDAAAFTPGVAWLARVGSPMPLGTHRIVVEGTVRSGSRLLRDAKEVTIEVVSARNGIRTTRVAAVTGDVRPPSGQDTLTTCTIADAGSASLVPLLEGLARGGPRADQAIGAAAARELLATALGRDDPAATAFDPSPFLGGWNSGISLLPYASPDLELTALVALGAPDVVPHLGLEPYLLDVAKDSAAPRDRRITAMTGLATLGFPVLDDLRAAAAATDLTPGERAWLAVGLAEAGDLRSAAAVERALLDGYGQRSGAWARVVVGSMAHTAISTTALLAIAAARIGDPLAPDLAAYVHDAVDTEAVHPLEEIAYAARALDHLPRRPAHVAITVQGRRTEATLGPRRSVTLELTPTQSAATVVRSLSGSASLVCSWEAPASGRDLPDDPSIAILRRVEPAGPIPAGSLVAVHLAVTLGSSVPSGFYRIVDTLPAGLAPTTDWVMERDAEGGNDESVDREQTPWSIEGNRVEWGFGAGALTAPKTYVFRVTARVVAPGGYTWEPAVVQLMSAPGVGSATPATGVTILEP